MAVLLAKVTADWTVMTWAADLEGDVPLWVERKVEAEDVADDERDDKLEDEREDIPTDELDGKREEKLEDKPEEGPEFVVFDDEELLAVVEGQPIEAERLTLTVLQSLEVKTRASGLKLV